MMKYSQLCNNNNNRITPTLQFISINEELGDLYLSLSFALFPFWIQDFNKMGIAKHLKFSLIK